MTRREQVRALLLGGLSYSAAARELGVHKSLISYYVDHPEESKFTPRHRWEDVREKYDWVAVRQFYEAGNGQRACQRQFGFWGATWNAAVGAGVITLRRPISLEEALVTGSSIRPQRLKALMVEAGLKEERCEGCDLTDWRNRPLTLTVHHKNGVHNDNRLENLEILCPNCHSQTDNFAGRNGHRKRKKYPSGVV